MYCVDSCLAPLLARASVLHEASCLLIRAGSGYHYLVGGGVVVFVVIILVVRVVVVFAVALLKMALQC